MIELAQQRIATSENLFKGATLNVPDGKGVAKLALILAHEMNPFEDFSAEEEGLIRGISADTLRKRKSDHVIRPL